MIPGRLDEETNQLFVGSPSYSIAFRKLIKICGCSEDPNILLKAKSVLGLIKRIYIRKKENAIFE